MELQSREPRTSHVLTLCIIGLVSFFLGVEKYTPNVAVQGEMAWSFPRQRTNMENRLNKRECTCDKQGNVKN